MAGALLGVPLAAKRRSVSFVPYAGYVLRRTRSSLSDQRKPGDGRLFPFFIILILTSVNGATAVNPEQAVAIFINSETFAVMVIRDSAHAADKDSFYASWVRNFDGFIHR